MGCGLPFFLAKIIKKHYIIKKNGYSIQFEKEPHNICLLANLSKYSIGYAFFKISLPK